MNKSQPSRRPIILIGITALFTILILLTIVMLPFGIGYGIKQWILDNGGERATIENVDFNPFTGDLAIYNLNVGRKDTAPLKITEAKLKLDWLLLIQNQVKIEDIRIHDVYLLVDQSKKGYPHIGGIRFEQDPNAAAADESSTSWEYAIQLLNMRDVSIDYKMPALTTRLKINHFEMMDLENALPDQQTTLKLDGQLDDAEIKLQGKLRPFSVEPGFQGKLELQDVTLNKYTSLLPASVSQLQGTTNINSELAVHLKPDGMIKARQKGDVSLNNIQLAIDANRFKARSLSWKGQADYDSGRHDSVNINLTGNTFLHDIQLATQDVTITSKTLQWKGKTGYKVDRDETTNLKLNGDLDLTQGNLVFPDEALQITQDKLSWSGNSDISMPVKSAGTLTASGKTSSKQLRLSANQRDTDVQYGQLGWDGDIKTSLTTGLDDLKASGDITIQSFQATAPNENYVLMAFEQLDINDFNTHVPQKAFSKHMQFSRLTMGKQVDTEGPAEDTAALSLVHYGKLALDTLQYTEDEGLAIHSIHQTDVTQLARRSGDGKWNAVRLVDLMKRAAEDKTEDTTQSEKSLQIKVNNIIVDGDSKVIFEDLQTDPLFRQELKVEQFRLENLDTQKPDQASPLKLEGVISPHAKIHLSGIVSPFAERLTMDIKGHVEGLPLPPLSSYSKNLIGYTLDSGKMDAEIALKADAGKLEGDNKLNLYQLEVTPLSPEKKKELDAKLDVPLETGLSMLRDKNNKIQLSLPLTGDVDNFELDPSDAINQAVGKAMKTAAKIYLSNALFPYGTLLTIVQMAGEQAMKVNLDPIFYTPGSTRLGTKDREYLDKVATILQERPEIHIKLCGIATDVDRTYLIEKNKEETDKKTAEQQQDISIDKQLELLANNRASLIEKYLVEEHETKSNRLISCQPRIEKDNADAKPRTELSI